MSWGDEIEFKLARQQRQQQGDCSGFTRFAFGFQPLQQNFTGEYTG
jgi:hypothetical protein